ncbi:MAG: hypothetical protein KGZ96_01415 [Clostridia bacterium]|nr:hypothetical protein [Clostridia bacterium]
MVKVPSGSKNIFVLALLLDGISTRSLPGLIGRSLGGAMITLALLNLGWLTVSLSGGISLITLCSGIASLTSA